MKLKLIFLFLVVMLYSCRPADHANEKQQFSTGSSKALDNYIDEVKEALLLPGISVVVIQGDSVYCHAAGIADEQKNLLKVNLPFSAGSISEPMLAMAVMKLTAAGKINLDDPVSQYLPYFKMGGSVNRSVTIRHLLSHTSGVQKYTLMWDVPNHAPGALEVTTRSIANQQPKFPVPGSRVSRSPYNYDILADVITKVTGQPFEAYVEKAVFKPLQMNSSYFRKPRVAVMPFSVTDWLTYTVKQDSLYPYNRENGGSNGLHCSTTDIASWMYMILNQGKTAQKTFVKEVVFDQFFSPQYQTGDQAAVGFGWEISDKSGEQKYTKQSKITNFSSMVTLIPETKTGVAVFSNIGNADTEEITSNIILWIKGSRLPRPKMPVHIAMSRKLAETNSMEEALHTYVRLKQSHSAQYDLGEAALNSFGTGLLKHFQDYEKAIAVFKFCTDQFPLSATGYLNLAEAYAARRNFAAARAALERSRPFQTSRNWNHSLAIERYISGLTADPDPG